MKKIIFICLVFMLSFNSYHSQELKNNVEFGVLGNLGFLHISYTRSIFNFSQFAVNTGLKAGYVPGSGDEESKHPENFVPNFAHINLPIEVLWKFHRSNNIGIGVSYSKIFVGSSEYGNRPKTNYNRVLGEISYDIFSVGAKMMKA